MLLQTLEERLATLRQRCAPLAQHATLSARFDRHLFRTRSTLLQGYLEEADANLAALRQAVKHEQLPQVARLAEHLASQLEAISRETAAVAAPVGHRRARAWPLAAQTNTASGV